MLFHFIKYTQPAWQFNLTSVSAGKFASCLVISEENIPAGIIDERYATRSARLADAGFRLWNKGVLLQSTTEDVQRLGTLEKPSLKDEYIFLRKYWGKAWTAFALLLRIFTFKNIFKEWK